MKKLLILLVAAAVVGFAISRARQAATVTSGTAESAESAPSQETAGAPAEPSPSAPPAVAEAEPPPAAQERAPEAMPLALKTVKARPVPAQRAGGGDPVAKAEPRANDEAADDPRLKALERAVALIEEGRRVEARRVLTEMYLEASGSLARKLRNLLDRINADLVFNPRCVEGAAIHVVQPGETLSTIGKKHGVNWRMIQRVNGMSHDRINIGQQLKILAGPASVVAYKGEFRLALLVDGAFVKEYPIGTGQGGCTPTGEFVVDNMLVRPRWYKPGGGIVEYGEEGHLLGERWIGFDDQPGASGLGIHGTNEESSIGTECSNGCLRMHNEDVMELYDFLQRGSRVTIRP